MRDDVKRSMNLWSVESDEQLYPAETGVCRLENLATVLSMMCDCSQQHCEVRQPLGTSRARAIPLQS
jgi:hypothetical protein